MIVGVVRRLGRLGVFSVLVGLAGLPTLVAGCSGSPTAPSVAVPFAKTDLRVGAGAEAVAGSVLTMHFSGWIYNPERVDNKGAQFATSAGGDPIVFTLGAGTVIEGWEQGIPGMRAGGLRRLVIPPSLAYGASRNGIIPRNATLLFDVELVAVE
jgi:FKBP-type peptidyl-prolyl cis-trans isomerase